MGFGMALERIAYRIKQGMTRILVAMRPGSLDLGPARAILSGQAWELFRQMSAADQAHALRVLDALRMQGPVSRSLAQAALLHDVGKVGGKLSLLYRTAIVMAGSHQRLSAWADPRPGSLGYPVFVHLHHAERGAEYCRQAGCDTDTIELVRWHETSDPDCVAGHLRADLLLLQSVDDHC